MKYPTRLTEGKVSKGGNNPNPTLMDVLNRPSPPQGSGGTPSGKSGNNPMDERMLKWFEYGHLPEHLQVVSKPFSDLAEELVTQVMPGPERTVALRKLLEAKDAAVRAKLHPGG